jgi:hypothetical protein
MAFINATIAEEITLKDRAYEGKDIIYELIKSAAKQGLSHITAIINKEEESKFIADMEKKASYIEERILMIQIVPKVTEHNSFCIKIYRQYCV